MQVAKDLAPTMFGIQLGPDQWQLRLNKREIDTLEQAIAIREEARDRLREGMGWEEFESSVLYVLSVDDLVDTPVINFALDYSGMKP